MLQIQSDSIDIEGFRAIVDDLNAACNQLEIDFLIVGALARDIMLEHVHGLSPGRATRDIDLGVIVEDWNAFEDLKQTLIDDHGFASTRTPHRLKTPNDIEIDLIPFGDIEDDRTVTWPPEQEFILSTLGFREAYATAVTISLDGNLPLKVVSLPGNGILKLIAWRDKGQGYRRHAEDFCLILSKYDYVRSDQLLDQYADLFNLALETDLISARVFGRDAAEVLRLSDELKQTILALLDKHTADAANSPLAEDMQQGSRMDYERTFECLDEFKKGVLDLQQ